MKQMSIRQHIVGKPRIGHVAHFIPFDVMISTLSTIS